MKTAYMKKRIVEICETSTFGTPVHVRKISKDPRLNPDRAFTREEWGKHYDRNTTTRFLLIPHREDDPDAQPIEITPLMSHLIEGISVDADLPVTEHEMRMLGFAEYESGEYSGNCIIHFRDEGAWVETIDGVLCYEDIAGADLLFLVSDLCWTGIIRKVEEL